MALESFDAYNESFTYLFPGESITYQNQKIKANCLGALVNNSLKWLLYIPIIGQIAGAILIGIGIGLSIAMKQLGQEEEVKRLFKMPCERAKLARAGLAAAGLGPVLLIVDLFSTLVIKPIYYCALQLHQRRIEQPLLRDSLL